MNKQTPQYHFACSPLQLQYKKWNSQQLISIRNWDENVKNPFSKYHFMQQLQQMCYESISSCSIRHPSSNVPQSCIEIFYFFYFWFRVILLSSSRSLLISSVFGCHSILVRRISWSLLSTLDLFLFYHRVLIFFPPDIRLPSSWLAAELCFMKTV